MPMTEMPATSNAKKLSKISVIFMLLNILELFEDLVQAKMMLDCCWTKYAGDLKQSRRM